MALANGGERERGIRSEALPENANYEDTGCHEHPRCLTCPLPQCVYENEHVKRETLQTRNTEMITLYESGVSMIEIGLRYGITRQTVHGVVTRRRKKTG